MENNFDDILSATETIIWQDQPRQDALEGFDMAYLGFCLMWVLVGTYLFLSGLFNTDSFKMIGGGVLVLIGFILMFGRLVLKNYQYKRTFYLITDRRVIIVMRLRLKKVLSIDLTKINNYDEFVHRNGTGTIDFDVNADDLTDAFHAYRSDGSELNSINIFTSTCLRNVADPDLVYQTFINAINEAKKGV